MIKYDLIVIGSGAAGIMSAITAARDGKNVLLLEKLPKLAPKLKATGGGRCNLTNTLSNEDFIARFGREGRFMIHALEALGHDDLQSFFHEIGVQTHAPDGFRVFPVTHSSATIINALEAELKHLGVTLLYQQKAERILVDAQSVKGVVTQSDIFYGTHVVLASGGLGYPTLGAEGDGYTMAQSLGHTVTKLHPAMMPLRTKERWVEHCRADTIANALLRVNLPKAKKLRAQGDLIFTKTGIRGPVVLDFAREVTPLLDKYTEVPLLINMTKGMDEDTIYRHIKNQTQHNPHGSILKHLTTLIPLPLAEQLCKIAHVDTTQKFGKLPGKAREKLIRLLAWTPLTITGHDGFKMAMITRGGISLKEISPRTMESKIISGLYFCGEIMDLDGPCGGYNLQWSFASGYLAGKLEKIT